MSAWAMHFSSEDEATNFAIGHLNARGFTVKTAGRSFGWETVKEFRDRHRLSHGAFVTLREHPGCPAFLQKAGPTGRLVMLKSNEALEEFVRQTTNRGGPDA